MPKAKPTPEKAEEPTAGTLSQLQARQSELIKKGQELMRELDRVTAQIAEHQAMRDDSAARWNKR